jgi:hypothetical protein
MGQPSMSPRPNTGRAYAAYTVTRQNPNLHITHSKHLAASHEQGSVATAYKIAQQSSHPMNYSEGWICNQQGSFRQGIYYERFPPTLVTAHDAQVGAPRVSFPLPLLVLFMHNGPPSTCLVGISQHCLPTSTKTYADVQLNIMRSLHSSSR